MNSSTGEPAVRSAIMAGPPENLFFKKAEWDRAPWNRWSFQHIRELLPTAEVWRGEGPVRALPRRDLNLDGLPVADSAGFGVSLAGLLEETFTDGILVIHGGAVIYERYLNGMTPRTLHLSQSVAKSVTGMAAGILINRGLLDPARQVSDYLPELATTAWNGATLQQVLDMTTGVKFSEEYTNPYSEVGQVDVASGWKPVPAGSDPSFNWPTHVWELILRLKETQRPHGAQFAYRSIETDVLAFCMERVTGKRLPQIISEEVWQKLGVEESASFTVDPAGYALADGGFNATLRDYGRFGLAVLEGGAGVIPASWIETCRNGNHDVFGMPYTVTLPRGAYHNQMWIEDPQSRSLMARGVFGQLIYVSWDYNMVVVKMSSWPDFLNAPLFNATLNAVHAVGRLLNR